jgi:hypothetical protein
MAGMSFSRKEVEAMDDARVRKPLSEISLLRGIERRALKHGIYTDDERSRIEAGGLISMKGGIWIDPRFMDGRKRDKELASEYIPDLPKVEKLFSSEDTLTYAIIECIGSYGISTIKEMTKRSKKGMRYSCDFIANSFRARAEQLVRIGVLRRNVVELVNGRRKVLYTFLRPGVNLYVHRFKKRARQSFAAKLLADHHDWRHGMFVLDTAKAAKRMGMETAIDRDEVKVLMPRGPRGGTVYWAPDVIGVGKDGAKTYFEAELGTTKQSSFERKLEHIAAVKGVKVFYVEPSIKSRNKVNRQINRWLLKKDKNDLDMEILVCTIAELRKKACSFRYFYQSIPGKSKSGPKPAESD